MSPVELPAGRRHALIRITAAAALAAVSDTNPTYVTGADRCRISFTALLMLEQPGFAELEERVLLPVPLRPEGYGLAFLEPEEQSVTCIGTIQQIENHREANAAGTAL
ncbi:hypothetical protein AB0878_48445 [Amycolatopsis sp. NPDC047767]|uniref:hypothetical protein n=1 Tax=Amycolatopsis sp. NPDC047767 TaxID=3156765 RepID=UPI00345541DA